MISKRSTSGTARAVLNTATADAAGPRCFGEVADHLTVDQRVALSNPPWSAPSKNVSPRQLADRACMTSLEPAGSVATLGCRNQKLGQPPPSSCAFHAVIDWG